MSGIKLNSQAGGSVTLTVDPALATDERASINSMAGIGFDFYGTVAPLGSLSCDGQAVSRTTYASLFAAIGTVHGAGDGSTTFNLPIQQVDGLGLFNRGVGSVNGGVGTYQEDVFKEHTHGISDGTSNAPTSGFTLSGAAANNTVQSELAGDPTETRPRSLTVLKCIWTGE